MEDGFFLRDDPTAHKKYECPDPYVDKDKIKLMQALFTPVELALGMFNKDSFLGAWKAIEVFIEAIVNLQAAVTGYPGSDFCSGLLFGVHGSRVLLDVGKVILDNI